MNDFLTNTIDSMGYIGVALLMLLENIVPPIPSEIVMPAAGASARDGQHSLIGMIVAGTFGSLAGALPWYGIARYVGTERFSDWVDRHGHWMGTNRKEIQRADEWFDRYGKWTVLLCRMIPGIRTLISVPAGFAEMPLIPFLLYSAIGTAAWTTLLACLGYWLQGQNETIANIVSGIGICVLGGLALWFVGRVILVSHRKRSENRRSSAGSGGGPRASQF